LKEQECSSSAFLKKALPGIGMMKNGRMKKLKNEGIKV
jgi:hypothetical protein